MNAAARTATDQYPLRDVFILADNDLIPDKTKLHQAIDLMDEHPCVVPFGINRNLTETGTVHYLASGQYRLFEDVTTGARSYVVIHADAYASVNGMDERFIGWGPEDLAFYWSVTKQVEQPVPLEGVRLHLWHPIDPSKTDVHQLRRNRMRARAYKFGNKHRVATLAREYGRWDDGARETQQPGRVAEHARPPQSAR